MSFCKQSFEIFIKISSHPEHMHTSLSPCWLLLPFDSRLQRSQLQVLHDSHKANVSLSQIQDSSKQANPMSSSTPIHIYLMTSINIRLAHGSRTTVANTKFHKKGQVYQKKLSENVLWLPYQIPSNPRKNPYIYCLLT